MTYRVKSWAKFQHFKDRRPPWIKLYRDLLDDKEWHKLDPVAAKFLVMFWLIASEDEGNLPDINTLAFRLRVEESDIDNAISHLSHWLEQVDITVISDRYQNDTPERETERETDTPAAPVSAPKKNSSSKREIKTPLPADFGVSKAVREWAAEKGYDRLEERLEHFIGYAKANAAKYADWDQAFQNSIRRDWANLNGKPGGGKGDASWMPTLPC